MNIHYMGQNKKKFWTNRCTFDLNCSFLKEVISSIYLFVESIFPFIIIIDYGRLQQSTDEGKRVYISWDCNRLNLSSHVCQVINYLEIEIMILIICFEELISTFNDKFRSMFLKNCVWKDILFMTYVSPMYLWIKCTFSKFLTDSSLTELRSSYRTPTTI